MSKIAIIHADVLVGLRTLPERSIQTCVTSPPYHGLRDYGVSGQLGSEERPDCLGWATGQPCGECYICHMVAVFAEVWRVLRDDGTVWLNVGDSYAHDSKWGGKSSNKNYTSFAGGMRRTKISTGMKPKDLMLIPSRLALALQAFGWTVRSDIIWSKANPMPESVADRPTTSHEHIFLLSKQVKYYYDAEAIAEPCSPSTHARISQDLANQVGTYRANGGAKSNGPLRAVVKGSTRKLAEHGNGRQNESMNAALSLLVARRNKRTVWEITTEAYKGAHFAVFPTAIPEICIKAGTKEGDTVLDPFCGAGTTGLVASRLGRAFVGIELNADYVEMARSRIYNDAPIFNSVGVSAK